MTSEERAELYANKIDPLLASLCQLEEDCDRLHVCDCSNPECDKCAIFRRKVEQHETLQNELIAIYMKLPEMQAWLS